MTQTIELNLSVYLVQSQDGLFFRAKGYNGYGDSWVKDPTKARVFVKIGAARAQVTFWANHYPQFGIPKLIELKSVHGVILEETSRVERAKERKQKKILRREEINLKYQQQALDEDLKNLELRKIELNRKLNLKGI